LVVVRDFDFVGMIVTPTKADPILVVDPDAVLPFPVSTQPFETVPWRDGEFPQVADPVQLRQLAPGN
jgi:hypothetical protein